MKPIDVNIEKVIKGLEICTSRPCYCTDCPYTKECCLDSQNVMKDALVLLKAQEKRINELKKKLRLLEYGDLDTLQGAMMPAT